MSVIDIQSLIDKANDDNNGSVIIERFPNELSLCKQ